jgi:hypothetical protein
MYKKIMASLIVICLVVTTSFMVFACGNGGSSTSGNLPGTQTPDFPGATSPSGSAARLESTIGNTWATMAFVVQTLSIGCVVVLGIRYMMASADKKADIKHGLTMVVIGATFVFCAATVARFIVDAGEEIL